MGTNLFLGSFAIIAAVTFPRFLEASGLGGYETPVWTAYCPHPGCDARLLFDSGHFVTYERLEKGAVRRAIDYMNSGGFQSLHPRKARSIEEYVENAEHEIALESSSGNRTKRYSPGVSRVKVLAVVQYDASDVTNDDSRKKFINENILYTLAYWRGFNKKVLANKRTKNWSKVSVELVGIIIALNRAATPYLSTAYGAQAMLSLSNEYWSQPNAEFPRNAYHAVATITDVEPNDTHFGFFECVYQGRGGGSGTIIAWDNKVFRAVHEYTSIAAFQQVVNTLHYWSVIRQVEVPDYMKPGPIAQEVLPGQLYAPEQQCWFHGYKNLDRLCPEYSKNCEIWCLNKGWFKSCGSVGKGFEGTPCVNGKVG